LIVAEVGAPIQQRGRLASGLVDAKRLYLTRARGRTFPSLVIVRKAVAVSVCRDWNLRKLKHRSENHTEVPQYQPFTVDCAQLIPQTDGSVTCGYQKIIAIAPMRKYLIDTTTLDVLPGRTFRFFAKWRSMSPVHRQSPNALMSIAAFPSKHVAVVVIVRVTVLCRGTR